MGVGDGDKWGRPLIVILGFRRRALPSPAAPEADLGRRVVPLNAAPP